VIHVVVVDDHPVARQGITAILASCDDVEVISATATLAEIPRADDGSVSADVLLLDLYLADGRPALAAIKEFSALLPVLILSASRAPADVLAAMQAGASGYLTKHASEEAYATALRTVAAGKFYMSAQLADLIQAATSIRAPARPQETLAPREQEALSYIARGFTHQQTGTRMGVSKATVDTYIARIRTKLQLGNKAELALAALQYLPKADDSERLQPG
jgi:DNA-binding NarL/FixJ family response regulator